MEDIVFDLTNIGINMPGSSFPSSPLQEKPTLNQHDSDVSVLAF